MCKNEVRQEGKNKLDVAAEANQCQHSNSDTDCFLIWGDWGMGGGRGSPGYSGSQCKASGLGVTCTQDCGSGQLQQHAQSPGQTRPEGGPAAGRARGAATHRQAAC